jgi:hypothetical protein
MIAGLNILYQPGTRVEYGGYMHGRIAPDGPWCGVQPATPVAKDKCRRRRVDFETGNSSVVYFFQTFFILSNISILA